MELIPILSTIILVATICTFILAIGAYILYKIRERRGEQSNYPPPSSVHAELVTPEEMDVPAEPHYIKTAPKSGVYPGSREYEGVKPGYNTAAEEEAARYEKLKKQKTTGKKFLKYTSEGYVPTEEDKNTGVLKWR
jgi:hypothetical protein